jgi:ribosomal protein S1
MPWRIDGSGPVESVGSKVLVWVLGVTRDGEVLVSRTKALFSEGASGLGKVCSGDKVKGRIVARVPSGFAVSVGNCWVRWSPDKYPKTGRLPASIATRNKFTVRKVRDDVVTVR